KSISQFYLVFTFSEHEPNFLLYMLFMVVTWSLFVRRYDDFSRLLIATLSMMSAGWTVGVILHGASLWLSSESGTRRMRERAVAREIQQEMLRLNLDSDDLSGWDEKAKRRERLMDEDADAELVDFPVRDKAFREDNP
ncbi:MAG: hypothetical protein ABI690_33120, partial [Chloroflexota bacterium]